jgi:uncharacterized protein (DUF1499 family)
MGLLRWFTKNWANTSEPTHPDLTPLALPLPPADAVEKVRAVVGGMGRWRVEPASPPDTLHLTRRTRLFRFVDDVNLRFVPTESGCLVHAESRSRLGKGDLGQNRRNILELWAAIRTNS